MKFFLPIIVVIIFTLSSGHAQTTQVDDTLCDQAWLEELPIQQNGRVKPLYVHSSELVKHLSGKSSVGQYSAVSFYCRLSMNSPSVSKLLSMKIEHGEVVKLLNLKGPTSTFDELGDNSDEIRLAYMRHKEEDAYKRSLGQLLTKIQIYKEIKRGENWLLPLMENGELQWTNWVRYSENPIMKLEEHYGRYLEKMGDAHLLELTYAKAKLPLWAAVCSLLALFMIGMKNFTPSLVLAGLSTLIQLILIVLRVLISGRAPVTNMYETVLFSGFAALLLGMIIGHIKKEKMYVVAGLGYNVCTLLMLNFAHGMLSASIGPLVPVLRDNFWLSTHVTSIIISYGALALSWILANSILIKARFFQMDSREIKRQTEMIYTCLKYGIVLLAAGIILGGVWADYSWGRFWGWDPKETWSLIVLCIYMGILHGRYTNWISTKRFIPLVAGAFMSVMMAWFGVNYILATGLHSYGFSQGGAIFIGTFFALQIALLAVSTPRFLKS